ncbi:hypothetical protein LXH09_35755 [Streptomyces sp. CS7]|uniref:hypothetical protein n=1 Tax=Streptomyces sp. CS-7 TaxID=2906769 RepID=UPI0021B3BFEB|nr:hypothetical protein [Streptomyces sp. CS-7]MCT6781988.1 hypothetical protein [Streptomyces sp. CS-7]
MADADGSPEDSYLDLPAWELRCPRWSAIHGRHHIPGFGTVLHRKKWYSPTVHIRFRAVGEERWQHGVTDWATLMEIITAGTLAEARTLVAWCLPDDR